MAGCSVTEESEVGGGRFPESILSGQQREAMAEWRSSEQVENGIPSTSPPYWDIEDDEGQKPCELYGKYTWKIDKFSQINKRELRSNAFEVGGYKWYILIYPQGCDVCNHLSLFLCVANHDKLLPGWSHFAQFTIAVVNKDPKKSKYSDTLHRFWKKEHDWGWKKFMELSKVLDGFIDADTLIIKAQVQVIRERAERPFRCLDIQYRRELVRVYLTNVEQICRRFVEERRTKLVNLIADKAKWTSFCAFWLGMDQNARRRMSREKTDVILKVVVKSFFIEKEVTSTLVMDSLYSGLKALEGQTKSKKEKGKSLDNEEELINPVIRTEKDMFVLIDDVLLLLERVAMEPLPPKDEKGPQNRTKDGSCGEDFNEDSIERDERRLTELGRRTIEIYVLAHIFSTKIEIAYQEAVAFKRQEELIREEEAAAWLAGSEKKTKKEKKSKKKQSKQKRNNSKSKDKGRDEKIELIMQDLSEDSEVVTDKIDVYVPEDVLDIYESLQVVEAEAEADSEERDVSPVNWDTDTSEVNPPTEASSSGVSVVSVVQTTPSLVDDTSSTCSTDSVVSGVINGDHLKNQKSPTRGQNHRSKASGGRSDWGNGTHNEPFQVVGKANRKIAEQHVRKAEEVSHVRKGNGKNEVDAERPSMKKKSVSSSPSVKSSSTTTVKNNGPISIPTRKPSSESPKRIEVETVVKLNKSVTSKSVEKPSVVPIVTTDKPSTQQKVPIVTTDKPSTQQKVPIVYDKPSTQQKVGIVNDKPSIEQVRVATNDKASSEEVLPIAATSRPLSAPGTQQQPEASASVALPVASSSSTSSTPLLARSVSATGRLGPSDTSSSSSSSYISQSQSYRNAMMGVNPPVSGTSHHHHYPTSSPVYSQPQAPTRMEQSFSFGGINHDGQQWIDHSSQVLNEIRNFDLYSNNKFHDNHHHLPSEVLEACTSGRQTHQVSGGGGGGVGDEFPHLDIINDLLDEDQNGIGSSSFYGGSQYQQLNRQLSYPGEIGPSRSSSSNSSFSRFERTRSYNEDVYNQRGYEGGSPFDQMRDMFPPPHSNNASYTTNRSHIDGVIPIPQQWQMPPPASDLSYLSNEYNNNNNNNNSYSYHVPDYSSSNRGGAYALFRPSTGL